MTDIEEMVEQDKERLAEAEFETDFGPIALVEAILIAVTGVVGVAWMAALMWTPDPIDGTTWMSGGVLGLILTGGPAVILYWLRRGGAAKVLLTLDRLTR